MALHIPGKCSATELYTPADRDVFLKSVLAVNKAEATSGPSTILSEEDN